MGAEIPISPEELGIPTDDLEKPTQETPKQPDQNGDNKSSVLLAEDIARFRTDMEQKIFWDRLPRNEWRDTYEETLAANPQIHEYKDIFDGALKAMEKAHDDLRAFWIRQHGSSEVNEKSSPEASKKIFESIFGFNPEGEVAATKGIVSLYLEVDDDVHRQFYKLADRVFDPEEHAFIAHSATNRTFPIMVVQKNLSEEDSSDTGNHEFEHVKTDILGTGRQNFNVRRRRLSLLEPERLTLPKAVDDRIKRRSENASTMENEAKDEILAYFTEPEWIAFPSESKLTQYLELYSEEITHKLTDENSIYLTKYKERFTPTSEEEEAYPENVRRGVDSIVQLFNLYFSNDNDTKKDARMAINVLEQFPLHSWPAVVRLVKGRHNQKEK